MKRHIISVQDLDFEATQIVASQTGQGINKKLIVSVKFHGDEHPINRLKVISHNEEVLETESLIEAIEKYNEL